METAKANPLGEFLRARREALDPALLGLPDHGRRRRARGLRREEVATLAGVSTDYYTRLEQGRERRPSARIVDALGRALRLDDAAITQLGRLAEPSSRHSAERGGRPGGETVGPSLRRLMDAWTTTPAFVLGHALDVLALNPLAGALFADFERADNLARMTFLDPAARLFHRDWDRAAGSLAGSVRRAEDAHPSSARLARLTGELRLRSPEFTRLHAGSEAPAETHEAWSVHHSSVGDLTVDLESFTVDAAPDQRLVVCHAAPGSRSADALALLGALATPSHIRPPGQDPAPNP